MKTLKMYKYWDTELNQNIQSFKAKDPNTDLIIYTLIADSGYYLYNIQNGAIRSAVTVPFYAKDNWEERAYK